MFPDVSEGSFVEEALKTREEFVTGIEDCVARFGLGSGVTYRSEVAVSRTQCAYVTSRRVRSPQGQGGYDW